MTMRTPAAHLCDENDTHYVADPYNAHIDTSNFENWLNEEVAHKPKDDWWPAIYGEVVRLISNSPKEPADDTLICRYLTPDNFFRFIEDTALHFTNATAFEDRRDCSLPDDYNDCVLEFLPTQGIKDARLWEEYAEQMRAQWFVSCWTELTDHYDDYLLWYTYTRSRLGVGITVRYHQLRHHLNRLYDSGQLGNDVTEPIAGEVEYIRSEKWQLRTLPFNKQRRFGSEKEIRFAFQSKTTKNSGIRADIADLKRCFGLRFSPDVPLVYVNSVREVWGKWGGEDRYHIVDQ